MKIIILFYFYKIISSLNLRLPTRKLAVEDIMQYNALIGLILEIPVFANVVDENQ
jgi:hypothetical protein